jgi:DNA-binding GntR family transcriptional regulator
LTSSWGLSYILVKGEEKPIIKWKNVMIAATHKGTSGDRILLKDVIYGKIKSRILSEEYPPRSFLSERMLSAQFKVSKTPVRNALERLATEGFVAISPQQGVVVQETTLPELLDLFDIRLALESFVASAITGKLTEAQKRDLQHNLEQQKASASNNDIEKAMVQDAGFHISLCEFLGNQEIIRVMRQSRDKMHRIINHILNTRTGRIQVSYEEHAAIAQAIIAGDAKLAAKRIKAHLEYGKQSLISR